MSDEEIQSFRDKLADASAIVATWPEWKRHLLEHSASPTVSVPRKPVLREDCEGW